MIPVIIMHNKKIGVYRYGSKRWGMHFLRVVRMQVSNAYGRKKSTNRIMRQCILESVNDFNGFHLHEDMVRF